MPAPRVWYTIGAGSVVVLSFLFGACGGYSNWWPIFNRKPVFPGAHNVSGLGTLSYPVPQPYSPPLRLTCSPEPILTHALSSDSRSGVVLFHADAGVYLRGLGSIGRGARRVVGVGRVLHRVSLRVGCW